MANFYNNDKFLFISGTILHKPKQNHDVGSG